MRNPKSLLFPLNPDIALVTIQMLSSPETPEAVRDLNRYWLEGGCEGGDDREHCHHHSHHSSLMQSPRHRIWRATHVRPKTDIVP